MMMCRCVIALQMAVLCGRATALQHTWVSRAVLLTVRCVVTPICSQYSSVVIQMIHVYLS